MDLKNHRWRAYAPVLLCRTAGRCEIARGGQAFELGNLDVVEQVTTLLHGLIHPPINSLPQEGDITVLGLPILASGRYVGYASHSFSELAVTGFSRPLLLVMLPSIVPVRICGSHFDALA